MKDRKLKDENIGPKNGVTMEKKKAPTSQQQKRNYISILGTSWELALGTLSFDTNENRLKKYIGNFLNDNINTIEELKTSKLNQMLTTRSFKVVASLKHISAVYDIDNWPKRIILSKLYKVSAP